MLARQWNLFDAHVFIGATGIAVRKTAPLLRDKATDPAVVCCSESGSHLIPLLSGHLGGGNRLARRLARISGGEAVITTATDTRGITAFDEAAAREKACVLNPDAIKTLNAALLAGDTVSFHGPQEIHERYWRDCPQVIPARADGAEAAEKPYVPAVYWDEEPPESAGGAAALLIQSSSFVLGIGCKKGTEPGLLQQYAEGFLARQGISRSRIKALASCTLKEQEPAILALAATWNVPFHVFEPAELDAVEIPTPSDAVFEKRGLIPFPRLPPFWPPGVKSALLKPFAAGTSRWPWQRALTAAGTRPVKEPEMSSSSGWGPGLRASLRRKRRQPWSNAPA